MMTEKWDQNKIKEEFSESHNFKELIFEIEKKYYDKGQLICEIILNNTPLNFNEEDNFANLDIQNIQQLEVKMSTFHSLIENSVNSVIEILLTLKCESLQISNSIKLGEFNNCNSHLHVLINETNSLVELLAAIKNSNLLKNNLLQNWTSDENKLIRVVKEIFAAYKSKDFVMLSDILEYDWIECIDTWAQSVQKFRDEFQ